MGGQGDVRGMGEGGRRWIRKKNRSGGENKEMREVEGGRAEGQGDERHWEWRE